MTRRRWIALALLLAAAPVRGSTQPVAGGAPPVAPRQIMQRLAQVVQRRLGLTDDQAAQLREVTGRFASQRQQLMQRERETRRALRRATEGGDSAVDQDAIAGQLDALVKIQQRRVQLVADEQRDLARVLTPLQRARFLALQERAFRAAQQVRQQRAAAAARPD